MLCADFEEQQKMSKSRAQFQTRTITNAPFFALVGLEPLEDTEILIEPLAHSPDHYLYTLQQGYLWDT